MALGVQTIVTNVRRLINDAGGDRWTDDMLFGWIHEAHIQLVNAAPGIASERGPVATTATAVQSLPGTIVTLLHILGVCNNSGILSAVVTEVDENALFLEDPTWMSTPAATQYHWARMGADRLKYYLYPAPSATGYVLMDYVTLPVLPTTLNGSLAMFTEVHLPLFVDFVVSRAFAVDADNSANAELAGTYLASFQQKLAEFMQVQGGLP